MGRLTDTHISENNSDYILLSSNIYNDLGELIDKKIHSEDFYNYLQSVDYKNNIRGWLTEINDVSDLGEGKDAFGLKLLYNEKKISGLNNNGLFNGNISSGIWSDAMDQSPQNPYTGDDLNRLRD